ncbi:MAG: VOC family protein [Vicinamibacterales bacterium]
MVGVSPPDYRLPAATRLGGVTLLVRDLGRSIDYYTHVLGLRLLSRRDWTAELGVVGSDASLLRLRAQPDVELRPVTRLGLFHFALLVPTRAALGSLLVHLVREGVPTASADHAVSEALYLTDPDGLGIEVYCDRPRPEWRANGDEWHMTTEPLDLENVMRSGEAGPFNGLSAGTVLGHMHLRVGSLDQAEAFYHRGLGFDKSVWSYPGALFLSAGGYHHHLGTNTWGGQLAPRAAREPGLLAWDIILPSMQDVGDAVRSLVSTGAHAAERDDGWAVADPWGTEVRLSARD